MNKVKKIFINLRVIIFLAVILFAVVAINPQPFNKGVTIRNVMINSSASLAGIESPKPTACLLYTSPSPRDLSTSRMPSSA